MEASKIGNFLLKSRALYLFQCLYHALIIARTKEKEKEKRERVLCGLKELLWTKARAVEEVYIPQFHAVKHFGMRLNSI
jgi:hypothetical protein